MDYTRFIQPVQGAQVPSEYDADSSMLADLIGRDTAAIAIRTLDLSNSGSIAIELPSRGFVPYFFVTGDPIKTRVPNGLVSVYIGTTQPTSGDQAFPAKHNRGFRGTFVKCYVSWVAQAGVSVDLVFHKSCRTPWMLDDFQLTSSSGNATLAGDNVFTGSNTFTQCITAPCYEFPSGGALTDDTVGGFALTAPGEIEIGADGGVAFTSNVDWLGHDITGVGTVNATSFQGGSFSGDGSPLTGYAPGFNVGNADNAFNISLSGTGGSLLYNNSGNLGYEFVSTDGVGNWNFLISINDTDPAANWFITAAGDSTWQGGMQLNGALQLGGGPNLSYTGFFMGSGTSITSLPLLSFTTGGSISDDGAGGLNFIGTTNTMDSSGNTNLNSVNTGSYKLEGTTLVESLSMDVFTFLPDATHTFVMDGNSGNYTIYGALSTDNGFITSDGVGDLTIVQLKLNNGVILDPSSNVAIDVSVRNLYASDGVTPIFQWGTGVGFFNTSPVSQQTGGAATAGILYTSVEQGMINRMYTALQNYGLIT